MQNPLSQLISGWGRVIQVNTRSLRPQTIADLQMIVRKQSGSLLAFGCGRSYGDVALNSDSLIITTQLNRFVKFDENKLELICESGVTIRDIQTTFLPRGYTLKTSPGTAEVTVGGAIANDVHGKNHDRVGSFGDHVKWIDLLLSSGEIIRCSESENKSIFLATIGGLGLTGIITQVCLQLQKNPIAVRVQNEVINSISELISRLRETRETALYSVAWIDLLSSKSWGRSVLSIANPDQTVLTFKSPHAKRIPSIAHIFLNKISMRLYNQWHYLQTERAEKTFTQSLFDYLYPLDAMQNWNQLYGKNGFYQFQCVIPEETAEKGIQEIISVIKNQSEKPYLTVLKTLGSAGRGLLSFPTRGLTLAMDFPNHPNTVSLFNQLTEITLKHHGRIYLAKDACMRAEQFLAMYPKINEFREIINEVDTKKLWQSELSRRLKIIL